MIRGRAMRPGGLTAAVLALIVFCGGCESTPRSSERPDDQPQKPTPETVLKQAPAHTVGVVHVDAEAIKPFLIRTAEEMKKTTGQEKAIQMLQSAAELAQKVAWLDVYVVSLKDQPPLLLLYFQTEMTADQFADLLTKVLMGWSPLHPLDRVPHEEFILLGPKDHPGVAITDTAAFSEIRNGVIVSPVRLEAVGAVIHTLGAGASDELAALAGEVEAGSPLWAALRPAAMDAAAPQKVLGHGSLEPAKASQLRMVFEKARQAEEFEQAAARMELAKVSRSDREVKLEAELNAALVQKLLAGLQSAQRQAVRVTSAAHLKSIGVAVAAFQADNYDKSPPNLKALVEKHLVPANMLVSPASRRQIKTDAKGIPTEAGDYVYFELPAKADASLVRAYEPPELNAGLGGNALLVDGSVHWMNADELEAAVKKTRQTMEKQGS